MQITLNLPDELIQHFNRDRLAREILEALVVQAYQAEKITSAEVGRILDLPSRWAVDSFLKKHNADLHYNEIDLGAIAKPSVNFGQGTTVVPHDCCFRYLAD
ncbi:UPF0175 family protein [Gloeocapsopsis crepidinum]|uniref:UPF0175 family protein n=1 Tax=Gloeocapsopsis crepidinum TaxID=693223 RepID=UPI001D152F5D|nr:UPF0175 family protein [Gloeocapsopsis crepidinum]